ncbi:MAG: hypothetical protein ACRDUY_15410 [Nitriliruptorales bacterium]
MDPPAGSNGRATSPQRAAGLALAGVGFVLVAVAAIANWTAAADLAGGGVTGTLAGAFAINTTGFGLAKLGIAVILVGIVIHLWHRANAVTAALPRLATPSDDPPTARGDVKTDFGPATATATAPSPLFINKTARALWLPVLAMGVMALAIGFVVGLVAANAEAGSESFRQLSAWAQGTLFLGEGLLLSGISFLLGAILAGLRDGGGQVQESLGLTVTTLKMPAAAKWLPGIMMVGMMAAIAQFVLYGVAAASAGDPASYAVWTTWLGPFRETALGVLLAGITLALFAISKVLGFQFSRIQQIVKHGV